MSTSYPTIAAINGHCIAGGVMFALAHDFRVMKAGKFKFCLSEVDLGMELPDGMMKIVKEKLKVDIYTNLIMYGKVFFPQDCVPAGIVSKCCEGDTHV